MNRGAWRDHVITVVISFISTVYGVALILAGTLMWDLLLGDGVDPASAGTAGITVMVVALVFIGIGAYSAAVVTANSFTTIVAGRIRRIAQLRLLGATANHLRRGLLREGVIAGIIGAALGLATGIGAYAIVINRLVASGQLPDVPFRIMPPAVFLPAVIAIITVALAAWFGSSAVARVSPVQALGADIEAPLDTSRTPLPIKILSFLGLGIGVALLALGAVVGAVAPFGLFIAFFGGIIFFTGFIIGARMVVPQALRLVGRMFGTGSPAALATSNATRSPKAATRSTIGMIVGITLTVMFVVAVASLGATMHQLGEGSPEEAAMMEAFLRVITIIAVALVSVSAAIGAAGMISNLSLGVLQRQRELGLLRAVGATGGQVRSSIVIEAALSAIVAIGMGLVLGIMFGWVGAQSTLGQLTGGITPLVVPWWLLVSAAGGALLLAAVTALAPAIRATRVAPIEALAVA